MRPSLLCTIPQSLLLFTPLIRASTTTSTISRTCASIPIKLSYPSCQRLSLFNSQRTQKAQMSSTSPEMGSALNKMADPEAESSKAAETKKEEKKAEPELPKLSAADFKIYNGMSEHMDAFVRSPLLLPLRSPTSVQNTDKI